MKVIGPAITKEEWSEITGKPPEEVERDRLFGLSRRLRWAIEDPSGQALKEIDREINR